jgi:uncharacterized membrane protein
LLRGKPGEIVIQAALPDEDTVLNKSAHKFQPGQTKTVPIFLYNFGKRVARGRLSVNPPKDWQAEITGEAEIAPGERKQINLKLSSPGVTDSTESTIRIKGNFGAAGRPVLSFRFTSGVD